MDRVVIVADDFTGACDAGVHFARGGMQTAFLFDREAIPGTFDDCASLAVSTGTRHLSARDAAEVVYESVSLCRQAGGSFFYKKIDSAMRGNPGAETDAVLQQLMIPAALVCPALPASGRSVVDGTLRVNGKPLHESSLGRDVFAPVDMSDVAECLMRQSSLRAGRVGLGDLERGREHVIRKAGDLLDAGCTAIVSDAVTDAHLALLADVLMSSHAAGGDLPRLLPVGSAGLSKALARAFSDPIHRETIRPRGRLLAVVGSLNETAVAQTEFAAGDGRYALLPFDVEAALDRPEKECEMLLRAAADADGYVLLHGQSREKMSEITAESGIRVANLYGRLVMALCRKLPFSTVFATGGDIAAGIARHLGLARMMLEEELLPGVVLSSCFNEETHVRWFISKAGSFGSRETLTRIADMIDR